MRTVNALLVLMFLLTLFGLKNSFGEIFYEYEVFADSDFSHPHDVCIDPGHGGPTALKYGNNGDGAGVMVAIMMFLNNGSTFKLPWHKRIS